MDAPKLYLEETSPAFRLALAARVRAKVLITGDTEGYLIRSTDEQVAMWLGGYVNLPSEDERRLRAVAYDSGWVLPGRRERALMSTGIAGAMFGMAGALLAFAGLSVLWSVRNTGLPLWIGAGLGGAAALVIGFAYTSG
jgi:hypothetical protein